MSNYPPGVTGYEPEIFGEEDWPHPSEPEHDDYHPDKDPEWGERNDDDE